jgi:hypothetical protein
MGKMFRRLSITASADHDHGSLVHGHSSDHEALDDASDSAFEEEE